MNVAKFLNDILTGIDGESYDVGRLLWVISCLIGLGLEIFSVITKTPFDLQHFGIGVGALLLAGGGALKLKSTTEPGVKA